MSDSALLEIADFLAGGEEETPTNAEATKRPSDEATKGRRAVERVEPPDDDKEAKSVLDDVIDVLMPQEEDDEASDEATKARSDEGEKKEAKPPVVRQPIIHDANLLGIASSWGIGPDEAASFPTERALLGEIAIRRMRFQDSAPRNNEGTKARRHVGTQDETNADDLPAPVIELGEDVDPTLKKAVETLNKYAVQLKDRADRELADIREQLQASHAQQQQAATRETRKTEAQISAMVDQEVAGWGDEFKELLGVPSKVWEDRADPRRVEVEKIRQYARERKAGFETLRGEPPTPEEVVGFFREARYVLYPHMIKQTARAEVANGLKKQRGGVGLRPGKSRSTEPVPQGDEAAKDGIMDYLSGIGLKPWAKRSA